MSATIAAIILAAGRSRRMGGQNKLLMRLGDTPIIRVVTQSVLASKARPIVVVTGHDRQAVEIALAGLPVATAHNPDHGLGLSTSLRSGIRALPPDIPGALICLGDMPRVTAVHLGPLLGAFATGREICVPVYRGRRGNPVLWGAGYFDEIAMLEGDRGAKQLLETHRSQIVEVIMPDDAVLDDIDTPAEASALRIGDAG